MVNLGGDLNRTTSKGELRKSHSIYLLTRMNYFECFHEYHFVNLNLKSENWSLKTKLIIIKIDHNKIKMQNDVIFPFRISALFVYFNDV